MTSWRGHIIRGHAAVIDGLRRARRYAVPFSEPASILCTDPATTPWPKRMTSADSSKAVTDERLPSDGRRMTRVLIVMGTAGFATVAAMRVADPLLPQVADDFDVTIGEAAIISSSFTIAYAIGQFVYGPLGDRFGKLRVIALMTFLSGVTVSAAGLAGSMTSLGVFRFLAGATTAAIVPLAMAFIGDHVDYKDRQAVLARFMSGTVMGVILGQAFGGLLGDWLGWRSVFPVLGAILSAMGLLLLLDVRRSGLPASKTSDRLSLRSLMDGYRALFLLPWARIILLIVFLEAFFFYSGFTFIGAYLHQRFEISLGQIGLILCAFGLGGVIYTLLVGWFVGRLGEHGISTTAGILLAIGFLALTLVPLSLMPLALLLLGLGLYLLHSTLQTNATQLAPERRGLAVATFANALFLGQALGIHIGGLIVDHVGFSAIYIGAGLGLLLLCLIFSRLISRRSAMGIRG